MTESGHAFGLEAEGTEDPLDELFADDPPAQEAPEPEPQAEAPAPEPTPEPEAEKAPEPESQPEAPVADADPPTDAEQPSKLWAGRFDSPEKLEESYKEAQRWGTRESQRRAELEREYNQLRTQLDQYRPYLERMAAQQQGSELVNELGEVDPAKVQSLVQQQAQAMFAQQQQAAEQAAARAEIEAFRSAHSDLDSTAEADIARLFAEYQSEAPDLRPTRQTLEQMHVLASDPRVKGQLDRLGLFPDPEYVAVAKELVDNPALAEVVEAHPHVVDSDKGMAWARQQASLPTVVAAAQTQASEQQTQATEQAKRAAYVEKGGTGAPAAAAPGTRPNDWLSEIMAVEQRDSPNSNVLGI
jgi:hypothetical protein